LTMAAVTRRAAEFGTLKAMGWRSRRIVGQVLGESATIGVIGAVAGVALGFVGAGIISLVAPSLSATVGGGGSGGGFAGRAGTGRTFAGGSTTGGRGFSGGGRVLIGAQNLTHKVAVPLHPSVSVAVIALAIVLAVGGGVLAGLFASWRIARLRPVAALARVA
ncbi:MAG: FtsX-like permease family protein, partial [Acidimicrobiales bacterium]